MIRGPSALNLHGTWIILVTWIIGKLRASRGASESFTPRRGIDLCEYPHTRSSSVLENGYVLIARLVFVNAIGLLLVLLRTDVMYSEGIQRCSVFSGKWSNVWMQTFQFAANYKPVGFVHPDTFSYCSNTYLFRILYSGHCVQRHRLWNTVSGMGFPTHLTDFRNAGKTSNWFAL